MRGGADGESTAAKRVGGDWDPELASSSSSPSPPILVRTVAQDTSAMYTVSHTAAMLAVALIAERIQPGCAGGAEGLRALPGAVEAAPFLPPFGMAKSGLALKAVAILSQRLSLIHI